MKTYQTHFQQTNQSKLKDILKKTYQMQETAINTNLILKEQTQKLENIHGVGQNITKVLKKANQTSKEMTSFWYSLGKKIKRVFVKNNDEEYIEDYNTLKNPNPPQKKNQETYNKTDIIAQRKRHHDRCHTQGQQVYKSDITQKSSSQVQDAYLDQMINQVRKLKGITSNTNQQLGNQHKIIGLIDKDIDKNSNKIEEINKRLKKKFF